MTTNRFAFVINNSNNNNNDLPRGRWAKLTC